MRKEWVNKAEIKVVGLSVRTDNKTEISPKTSKIGDLTKLFWSQKIADQIPHRTNPGVTLCVYSQYKTTENCDYTYLIGEEVNSFDNVPSKLQKLTIPAAKYQKFTSTPGKMPDVVIHAWQQIWKMTSEDLEGHRAYMADFEVYDQRAINPDHTILDIYIGIK